MCLYDVGDSWDCDKLPAKLVPVCVFIDNKPQIMFSNLLKKYTDSGAVELLEGFRKLIYKENKCKILPKINLSLYFKLVHPWKIQLFTSCVSSSTISVLWRRLTKSFSNKQIPWDNRELRSLNWLHVSRIYFHLLLRMQICTKLHPIRLFVCDVYLCHCFHSKQLSNVIETEAKREIIIIIILLID